MSNEKKEALALAMAQIEKQFGKGSVMRLGENSHYNVDLQIDDKRPATFLMQHYSPCYIPE